MNFKKEPPFYNQLVFLVLPRVYVDLFLADYKQLEKLPGEGNKTFIIKT